VAGSGKGRKKKIKEQESELEMGRYEGCWGGGNKVRAGKGKGVRVSEGRPKRGGEGGEWERKKGRTNGESDELVRR